MDFPSRTDFPPALRARAPTGWGTAARTGARGWASPARRRRRTATRRTSSGICSRRAAARAPGVDPKAKVPKGAWISVGCMKTVRDMVVAALQRWVPRPPCPESGAGVVVCTNRMRFRGAASAPRAGPRHRLTWTATARRSPLRVDHARSALLSGFVGPQSPPRLGRPDAFPVLTPVARVLSSSTRFTATPGTGAECR